MHSIINQQNHSQQGKHLTAGKAGYVTISVDDGHPDDVRTADLLNKYSIPATFYIPAKNSERKLMDRQSITSLADGSPQFEIGGHTYSHIPLNRLSFEDAFREVSDGKDWLEQLTGLPVSSFCYPKGKFSRASVQAVRKAGFKGARTCMFHLLNAPKDPMLWGVSTHAYNQTRTIEVRHALLESNYLGLANFLTVYRGKVDWVEHFNIALDYVETNGGVAHLYFHSWEISDTQQWQRLEQVFKNISKREKLVPVTNGDLFEF